MTQSTVESIEEWRPVVNFEGWYEVSNAGRVKRVKPARGTRVGKILKQINHPEGYLQIALRKDGRTHNRLSHQLVAEAFIGPCPEGLEVNHKDTNKKNNDDSNLEYCTRLQNITHAIANGLRGYPGMLHRRKLLPDQEARRIHRRRSMPRCERPTPPT